MRYTPPTTLNDTLRHLGWPADVLGLDDVERIDQVFSGTPLGDWARGIVDVADSRMPDTTGVGYLDEEYCLVGVGLADGTVAGCQTKRAVTDLDRGDACFTLRAFEQGYKQVRPMPLAPVAIYDVVEGIAPDGSRFEPAKDAATLTAAAMTDLPPAAKIFVEVDPEQRDVVYDVWAVAPGDGGPEIWRRNDGKWEPDPGWLSTLRGSAPPTLIYLATASPVLADLLSQVDTSTAGKPFQALQASAVLSPEFYVDLLPLLARGTRGGLSKESGVGNVLESFGSGPVTLLPLIRTSILASAADESPISSDVEILGITAAAWAGLEGSADVLTSGDKFHVLGADTQRGTTEVVDGEVALDRSDQSAVDVPMYLYRPPIDADQPVPVGVLVPGPQPASVGLFDPRHDSLKRVKFGFVREIALVPEAPVAGGAKATRIEGLVASAGGRYTRGTGAAFALVAGAAEPTSLDGLVAARSNAGHVVILRDEDLPQFTTLLARGTRGGLSKAAGVGKGGGAEQLRRYWSEGEGGKVKIRWGVGGDWYRCVKHLRKYMGTRAKGYCALLHKRALGFYPATHAKMEKG